jgi:hypothetical protein
VVRGEVRQRGWRIESGFLGGRTSSRMLMLRGVTLLLLFSVRLSLCCAVLWLMLILMLR